MTAKRSRGGLLARVNFPLYTLQMLTSRHILVGGGGGSSKTGVANGFEIFELFHNGIEFVAEEVTRHETGPSVVMNCATFGNGKKTWIVAGQESHCQLYSVSPKVVGAENGQALKGMASDVGNAGRDGLRQRTTKNERNETLSFKGERIERMERMERMENAKDDGSEVKGKRLELVVKPVESVQTDFSEGAESLQRIVRVSLSGRLMVTGGTDGCVRLWKFPELQKLHDLKGHDREIDDIDFSPDGSRVISVAKDGRAILWNVEKGRQEKELEWKAGDDSAKYAYKRCRFRRPESKSPSKVMQLFVLSNSLAGKNPSFLQLWDVGAGSVIKSVPYKETLSALAVSDDSKFVAVGTMFSGSVDILIAFSLRRALRVSGAHSMFVTGLEFLPTCFDGPAITSNAEAAVVSISVDNRICIHSIPFRHTLPFWFVIVLIVMSICGAFVFCSYFGI